MAVTRGSWGGQGVLPGAGRMGRGARGAGRVRTPKVSPVAPSGRLGSPTAYRNQELPALPSTQAVSVPPVAPQSGIREGLAALERDVAPASPQAQTIAAGVQAGMPAAAPGGPGAQRAIAWAASKLGVREQGANRGAAVDAIQRNFGMAGQPWCGLFVGSAARAAGARGITSRIASVPNIVADAQRGVNGFTGWSRSARSARPGDAVVLFGGGHVEMVTAVNRDGSLQTIGGNTSAGGGEGVARKTRPASAVTGIGHIRYG